MFEASHVEPLAGVVRRIVPNVSKATKEVWYTRCSASFPDNCLFVASEHPIPCPYGSYGLVAFD